jgi:hypothetical protein
MCIDSKSIFQYRYYHQNAHKIPPVNVCGHFIVSFEPTIHKGYETTLNSGSDRLTTSY